MTFSSQGFGQHRQEAINLLKRVISILDEYSITNFLISGTLLGYIRQKDFIPWDDDIDLLVDTSIYEKLDSISNSYSNINIFYKKGEKYDAIKFCFQSGQELTSEDNWEKYGLRPNSKYTWPFVDLFVYETGPGIHNCATTTIEESGGFTFSIFNPFSGTCKESFRFFTREEISFFHNDWKKSEFFTAKKVEFLGITCSIPNNPDYFLKMNYDGNYMTEIKYTQTHK